jgi:hypothetical protein
MSPSVDITFPFSYTFSVIYLSLSEIPIWTHQRQFGLKSKKCEKFGFGTRNFFNSNPGGYLKMH